MFGRRMRTAYDDLDEEMWARRAEEDALYDEWRMAGYRGRRGRRPRGYDRYYDDPYYDDPYYGDRRGPYGGWGPFGRARMMPPRRPLREPLARRRGFFWF